MPPPRGRPWADVSTHVANRPISPIAQVRPRRPARTGAQVQGIASGAGEFGSCLPPGSRVRRRTARILLQVIQR